jgi:hypothetical protein
MSDHNLFIEDESKIKQRTKTTVSTDQKNESVETKEEIKEIPSDYIPVTLSSVGKLDMPKKVHVRNYTGEDAIIFSTMTGKNAVKKIIKILNNIIYEDIDCFKIHENEAEEIMLNVYLNWWAQKMEGYPYPWTEEEVMGADIPEQRKNDILEGKEIPKITVNLQNISTQNLIKEFKEPIIIKRDDGTKVYFRLPRLSDAIKAQNYVEQKYNEQENKFSKLRKDIEYNNKVELSNNPSLQYRPIDPKEREEFDEYEEQRDHDYIVIKKMQTVQKIGDTEIQTDDDRLELYSKIDLGMWDKYNKLIENRLYFGVIHDMNVVSPVTGKEVTRRLQFQALDFIPTMELPDDSKYTVLFGE